MVSALLARARRNCVASIIVLLSMNVSMRSGMTVLRIEKMVFCDGLCGVCVFVGVCVVCGCAEGMGFWKGDFARRGRVRFWHGFVVQWLERRLFLGCGCVF